MTYYAKFNDGGIAELCADNKPDAHAEAVEMLREFCEWGGPGTFTTTSWDDYAIAEGDSEPAPDSDLWECHTAQLDPPEPDCEGNHTHDWQSPHDIVGGIKENPGVWGHGGGVTIREVCLHCGCGRLRDTWAQRSDTGEQGLESITYDPNYLAERTLD